METRINPDSSSERRTIKTDARNLFEHIRKSDLTAPIAVVLGAATLFAINSSTESRNHTIYDKVSQERANDTAAKQARIDILSAAAENPANPANILIQFQVPEDSNISIEAQNAIDNAPEEIKKELSTDTTLSETLLVSSNALEHDAIATQPGERFAIAKATLPNKEVVIIVEKTPKE